MTVRVLEFRMFSVRSCLEKQTDISTSLTETQKLKAGTRSIFYCTKEKFNPKTSLTKSKGSLWPATCAWYFKCACGKPPTVVFQIGFVEIIILFKH